MLVLELSIQVSKHHNGWLACQPFAFKPSQTIARFTHIVTGSSGNFHAHTFLEYPLTVHGNERETKFARNLKTSGKQPDLIPADFERFEVWYRCLMARCVISPHRGLGKQHRSFPLHVQKLRSQHTNSRERNERKPQGDLKSSKSRTNTCTDASVLKLS